MDVQTLDAPTKVPPPAKQQGQAEATKQRLAQFRQTMALIHAMPDHRAEAGLGPLPDSAIADAYDEREGVSP
jgi:hypothetical protein